MTLSGERNRPRASVSLTSRMLDSGVFNSCVTADTNSDFIVARTAADRAARTVNSNATIAAAAAIEINVNVRLAPLAAAKRDSSAADSVRAVQYRNGRASPGVVALSTGSKNKNGNFRSKTDACALVGTLPAGLFEAIRPPFSSKTSSTML